MTNAVGQGMSLMQNVAARRPRAMASHHTALLRRLEHLPLPSCQATRSGHILVADPHCMEGLLMTRIDHFSVHLQCIIHRLVCCPTLIHTICRRLVTQSGHLLIQGCRCCQQQLTHMHLGNLHLSLDILQRQQGSLHCCHHPHRSKLCSRCIWLSLSSTHQRQRRR